jgi:hypothetical protein
MRPTVRVLGFALLFAGVSVGMHATTYTVTASGESGRWQCFS